MRQARQRGIQTRKQQKLDRSDQAARKIGDWHVVGVEDDVHSAGKTGLDRNFEGGNLSTYAGLSEAEERHPWAATRLQVRRVTNCSNSGSHAAHEPTSRRGRVQHVTCA